MKNVKMVIALLASVVAAPVFGGVDVKNSMKEAIRVSFGRTLTGDKGVANDKYSALNPKGWSLVEPGKSVSFTVASLLSDDVYVSLDKDNSHKLKAMAFDLIKSGLVNISNINVTGANSISVGGKVPGKDQFQWNSVSGELATKTCTAPCTCTCQK